MEESIHPEYGYYLTVQAEIPDYDPFYNLLTGNTVFPDSDFHEPIWDDWVDPPLLDLGYKLEVEVTDNFLPDEVSAPERSPTSVEDLGYKIEVEVNEEIPTEEPEAFPEVFSSPTGISVPSRSPRFFPQPSSNQPSERLGGSDKNLDGVALESSAGGGSGGGVSGSGGFIRQGLIDERDSMVDVYTLAYSLGVL